MSTPVSDHIDYSEVIGGKAKGLNTLLSNGMNTPRFLVLSYGQIQRILEKKIDLHIIVGEWTKAENISDKTKWAVRSSASGEDSAEKSFAGQFTTVLDVTINELDVAVEKVLRSYNQNSIYAEQELHYGIVIQEMLQPDYSGVFFSKDPLKPYSDQPVINVIPGLGDKLVSGELSGYHIGFEGGSPLFDETDEVIEGETRINGVVKQISVSSKKIQHDISEFIPQMLDTASKLERSIGKALDFEFAIQNGKFYWLQMRPITTRGLVETYSVWDNTSQEANYPGITLPLSISFNARTLNVAYGSSIEKLKFDRSVIQALQPYLRQMSGNINGQLFYNMTAWQNLLYQLPFGKKLANKFPEILGMESIDFVVPSQKHLFWDRTRVLFKLINQLLVNNRKKENEYFELHRIYIEGFEQEKIADKSREELIDLALRIENGLGKNWMTPVSNGLYTVVVHMLLKRKLRGSKLEDQYPNYNNDILMADGEVISVELVRSFQALLDEIVSTPTLNTLFEKEDIESVYQKLKLEYPDFYKKVVSYISKFGNRTAEGELKIETITYQMDPLLFVEYLKVNAINHVVSKQEKQIFNYKQILKEVYPLNFLNRWIISTLTKRVITRVKKRENFRFMRTDTFAVMRSIFLQIGQALFDERYIADPRDVLYLLVEEIFEGNVQEYKDKIAARKKEYHQYLQIHNTNRYVLCKGELFPIELSSTIENDGEIRGIGCCSGWVEREVVIIDKDSDLKKDYSNKILVSHYFEPGWIHLFNSADGIISERGNLLSHTAIICRELNVPSIVGAKGILANVKDGDIIQMDGARGIIKFEHDESV